MVVYTKEDKNLSIPRSLGNFITDTGASSGMTPEQVQQMIDISLEDYNRTDNFKTVNDNSLIGTGNIEIQGGMSPEDVESAITQAITAETARTEDTYQHILTAGENITISGDTISATGSDGTPVEIVSLDDIDEDKFNEMQDNIWRDSKIYVIRNVNNSLWYYNNDHSAVGRSDMFFTSDLMKLEDNSIYYSGWMHLWLEGHTVMHSIETPNFYTTGATPYRVINYNETGDTPYYEGSKIYVKDKYEDKTRYTIELKSGVTEGFAAQINVADGSSTLSYMLNFTVSEGECIWTGWNNLKNDNKWHTAEGGLHYKANGNYFLFWSDNSGFDVYPNDETVTMSIHPVPLPVVVEKAKEYVYVNDLGWVRINPVLNTGTPYPEYSWLFSEGIWGMAGNIVINYDNQDLVVTDYDKVFNKIYAAGDNKIYSFGFDTGDTLYYISSNEIAFSNNFKTINYESVIGQGNIDIPAAKKLIILNEAEQMDLIDLYIRISRLPSPVDIFKDYDIAYNFSEGPNGDTLLVHFDSAAFYNNAIFRGSVNAVMDSSAYGTKSYLIIAYLNNNGSVDVNRDKYSNLLAVDVNSSSALTFDSNFYGYYFERIINGNCPVSLHWGEMTTTNCCVTRENNTNYLYAEFVKDGVHYEAKWQMQNNATPEYFREKQVVTSTSVATIWKGTQAQYDAITTKDPNTLYIIKD